MSQPLATQLEPALRGDRAALRALVAGLTPVLQARVARVLLRRSQGRPIRDELQDMVQDVLVVLFSDDARVLRAWRADKGLSLESYAAMVAERRVRSRLRSRKRNPWTEEPATPEQLARVSPSGQGPERAASVKEQLRAALARLREELTPSAFRLFELIWVEERSVEAICAELSMSRDAVYQGKRRIRKVADAIAAELRAADDASLEGAR